MDSTLCRFIVLRAAHSSMTFLALLCYLALESGESAKAINEVVKSDLKGSDRDDGRARRTMRSWLRYFGWRQKRYS